MDLERMEKLAKGLAVLEVEARILELDGASYSLGAVIGDVLYQIQKVKEAAAEREMEES